MSGPILPGATLGVLGGGQLGRMFTLAARRMGYRVTVFAPEGTEDDVLKGDAGANLILGGAGCDRSGEGFAIYVNGKLLTQAKGGFYRNSGIRGAYVFKDILPEFKGGKVEYRTDRNANLHVPIGKASFDAAALQANYNAVMDEIVKAKPSGAKGNYIKKISLKSTMGPGLTLDPSSLTLA